MQGIILRVIDKCRRDGVSGLIRACVRKVFSIREVTPATVALAEVTKSPDFVIVQLGAFVGNTPNDPIYHHISRLNQRLDLASGDHKLILVEPVRDFFEQLQTHYEDIPGVYCENVAISDQSGPAKFYRLGVDPVEHGYPGWLSQISSLKENRLGSLWDSYEGNEEYKRFYLKHRVAEEVECVTFKQLAERHGMDHVDFLQMDVEGFEFEILRSIDFEKIPIRFINYESVLLRDNKRSCETLLRDHGYDLIDHGLDTFCFREPDRQLIARWR